MVNAPLIPSEVLSSFFSSPQHCQVFSIGEGLVHDSYLVVYEDARYVLQKINQHVFKSPIDLVSNHQTIYDHLTADDNYRLQVPELISTPEGLYLTKDGWRCLKYISHATDHQFGGSAEEAHMVAHAIAQFDASLAALDPSSLHDTIPYFHDPSYRLQNFKASLKDSPDRLKLAEQEIVRVDNLMWIVQDYQTIKLPVRIAHNDPKPSNILCNDRGEPVAIIDLDTVMAGTPLHDFGDLVRTLTNSVAEDHPHMKEVNFQKDIYAALEDGFAQGLLQHIAMPEIKYLSVGAAYIIFEQALRFLTDFLNHDIYYHTQYDLHNLHRTQNQLTLLEQFLKIIPFQRNISSM